MFRFYYILTKKPVCHIIVITEQGDFPEKRTAFGHKKEKKYDHKTINTKW